MKQGNWVIRAVVLLVFFGTAAYLGVYAWRGLSDPFTTVMTYRYSMDDAAEAEGLLVRREVVLPRAEGIVDVLPAEGEKVGAGHAVAMLYRDTAALDRKQERGALQAELEQLNYALRRRDSVGDVSQLDTDIVQSMAALRGSTAAGDLSRLEDDTLALRSLVLKRMDTFSTNAESIAAIEAMIDETGDRLRAMNAVAASDSTAVTAPVSGVYSSLVDGYETVIDPDGLAGLNTSDLHRLLGLRMTRDESALGKLITDSRWYFAALLDEASAARLEAGKQTRVCFSKDFAAEVSMRVESVSAPEQGYCAVVFSSTHYLAETTLLRKQSVEVLFHRYEGIRVPKESLRVADGRRGVYVVVGAQAEFKEVDILREGETFYLVTPVGEGRRILRAGDEVIVTAENLYDGKVVR